ncbi:MAG: DUF6263 family protein [Planctomycetota bacterium]
MLARMLASAVIIISAFAQDGQRVEWKFKKSEPLRYRISQASKQETKSGGVDVLLETKTEFLLKFDILDIDADGAATLSAQYEAARATLKSPKATDISFDSTRPAREQDMNDPYVRMMAMVIGRKFTVRLNKRGEILSLGGASAIVEEMLKASAGVKGQQALRDALMQTFGDDAMRRTISTFFHVVPEKNIKISDTWKSKENLLMPDIGKIEFEHEYTVRRFENLNGDGCVRADLKIRPKLEVDAASPTAEKFEFKLVSGEGSGELLFSFGKGRSMKAVSKYKMEILATPKIPEGTPKIVGPAHNIFHVDTTIEWIDKDGKL